MKTLLVAAGVGIGCFLLGRFTADVGVVDRHHEIADVNSRMAPISRLASESAPAEAAPRRPPRRPTETKNEARVSIPLRTIVGILKEGQASSDFEDINRKMPDALTFLGASESERQAALDVMTKAKEEMYAEERENLKIVKADDAEVIIDHGGMQEPALRVAEHTREQLRRSLPNDTATALIDSIPWDRFYSDLAGSATTRFRIVRDAQGFLAATVSTANHSFSSRLSADKFPDDGNPIPADDLFGSRWGPFMKGRSLVPAEK